MKKSLLAIPFSMLAFVCVANAETYDQSGFYIGGKFAVNLASWDNKYSVASDPADIETDRFSLAQQLGFDVSAGYQFVSRWRAELNYGYTGKYEDKDSGANFSIGTQYAFANAIYTFGQWERTSVYGGLGAGAAFVQSKMAGPIFIDDNNETKTGATYAANAMLGLEEMINYNLGLNIQYRFMLNGGHRHNRAVAGDDTMRNDIGSIITHSIMVGAKYKF